jgi:arsenate reductase-like glutaredoxin family protein
VIKANFKLSKESKLDENKQVVQKEKEKEDLTQEEFEEFVSKSGAAGSFMIFRSNKKYSELGLDEL